MFGNNFLNLKPSTCCLVMIRSSWLKPTLILSSPAFTVLVSSITELLILQQQIFYKAENLHGLVFHIFFFKFHQNNIEFCYLLNFCNQESFPIFFSFIHCLPLYFIACTSFFLHVLMLNVYIYTYIRKKIFFDDIKY